MMDKKVLELLTLADGPYKCVANCLKLAHKKALDYNGTSDLAKVDFSKYFPFGLKSYLHMIVTKVNRVISIEGKSNVNFESIEDSLMDLVNYTLYALDYIRKQRADTEPMEDETSHGSYGYE